MKYSSQNHVSKISAIKRSYSTEMPPYEERDACSAAELTGLRDAGPPARMEERGASGPRAAPQLCSVE